MGEAWFSVMRMNGDYFVNGVYESKNKKNGIRESPSIRWINRMNIRRELAVKGLDVQKGSGKIEKIEDDCSGHPLGGNFSEGMGHQRFR